MTLKKSMGYYLALFLLGYIGITIVVAIIGAILSSSMSGMTVVAPFVAAMLVAGRFLKVENRRPTDAERSQLTTGSFLIFVGINVLLLGLLFLTGIFTEAASSVNLSTLFIILGVIFAVVFLITYFMIRWAYGNLLNKQADKMGLNNSMFD